MENGGKKRKRRVAAGTAATVTAASLLVSSAVSDPAELLQPKQQAVPDPSHVATVDQLPHRSYIVETDQYEPLTWRERACLWMQSLPLPVRALILLPLWGIGEVLTILLTALIQSPIGRALLHGLLEIGLLIGLFALVWKLLFPNVPLKKIFNKRTLPWLIGGALLLAIANAVLGLIWDDWKIWRIVLYAAVGFGVLLLLWWRVLRNLPLPGRKKKRVELIVQ